MISRFPEGTFRRRLPLVVGALSVLVLGSGPVSGDGENGLVFSHKLHVLDLETECTVCHEGASTSLSGADDLLPPKSICAQCHDVEDPGACMTCHRESPPSDRFSRILDYSPRFSHARHLKEYPDCNRCHPGVASQEKIESPHLPGMTDCMACHSTQKVSNACLACHLPGEDLRPEDHRLDWEHRHQDFAGREPGRCEECHKADMCQECHQGDNLFQRSHPANYEYDHAFDARGQERECSVCHETEFCVACHRDNNVVSHPVFDRNWANRSDGGAHREEAESDLGSCIACHDEGEQDPICAQCHGSDTE